MKWSLATGLLAASLVLNAVLVGLAAGRFAGRSAPVAKLELERYGPTSDVVAAAWEQLPEADQQDLRRQLLDEWNRMEPDRKRLRMAGNSVYEAAFKEPFDEAGLRDALVIFQYQEKMLQQRAENILISHLGKMPAEARATAAVGMLTPFNARVQRVDGAKGQKPLYGPGARTEAQPAAPGSGEKLPARTE